MKSLDTNVLTRFFIDDPDDAQAAQQRPAAVATLSEPSIVTVTVLLEFERVMRGFYGLARADITQVLSALLGIEHITIEDREAVTTALDLFDAGMDSPMPCSWSAATARPLLSLSIGDWQSAPMCLGAPQR